MREKITFDLTKPPKENIEREEAEKVSEFVGSYVVQEPDGITFKALNCFIDAWNSDFTANQMAWLVHTILHLAKEMVHTQHEQMIMAAISAGQGREVH